MSVLVSAGAREKRRVGKVREECIFIQGFPYKLTLFFISMKKKRK